VDAHTFTKQAENVQTNIVCQKADVFCFLGKERNADGGIHTTRDNNTLPLVYCKTLKKTVSSHSVHVLHDNAHLHTAACTWALLEHFNWKLFDHPPHSPDLAPSDYNLFTYLKNWLG
jgi:hypothetical protein